MAGRSMISMMKGHGWIGENEEIEKSLALRQTTLACFSCCQAMLNSIGVLL